MHSFNKANFKEWMLEEDNKSANTASNYMYAVDKISLHYSKETGQDIDLYKLDDVELVQSIAKDYSVDGRFSGFGYENHGTNRNAIATFAQFVMDVSDDQYEEPLGNLALADEVFYNDYSVRRLENNSIKIIKEGLSLSPVKPKLRELAEGLNVSLLRANGTKLNTQDLGRKVISAIRSINHGDYSSQSVNGEEASIGISYPLNVILYGSPGTGKTYRTINKALEALDKEFAVSIPKNISESEKRRKLKKRFDELRQEGKIAFTTFHQSFSYEDFIEGVRANAVEGGIKYEVEDGVFKRIAGAASLQEKSNYVLIIDEINRGNIANIFGELITLIEPSKRAGEPEALSVTLPYSKEEFSVPNNLYIIGTMNTADRSLALMDTALRRRFHFEEMMPEPERLHGIIVDGVNIELLLARMNKRITALYDRDHTLGHAFFIPLREEPTLAKLREVFERQILPLLQEYFFEDWNKIRLVVGKDLIIEEAVEADLFDENLDGLVNPKTYRIHHAALDKAETYTDIYEKAAKPTV